MLFSNIYKINYLGEVKKRCEYEYIIYCKQVCELKIDGFQYFYIYYFYKLRF